MERSLPILGIVSALLAGFGVVFVPDGSGVLLLYPLLLFVGAVLILLDQRGKASIGLAVLLIVVAFVSLLAYADVTVNKTSLSWYHNNLGPNFMIAGAVLVALGVMVLRWEHLDPQWFVVTMAVVHVAAFLLIMAVPRGELGVPFATNAASLVPAALFAYACSIPGITVLARRDTPRGAPF